MIDYLD